MTPQSGDSLPGPAAGFALLAARRGTASKPCVSLAGSGCAEGGSAPVATEPLELVSKADRTRLPEDIEDAYPLSHLQAGMLYHMQLTIEGAPDYRQCQQPLPASARGVLIDRFPRRRAAPCGSPRHLTDLLRTRSVQRAATTCTPECTRGSKGGRPHHLRDLSRIRLFKRTSTRVAWSIGSASTAADPAAGVSADR